MSFLSTRQIVNVSVIVLLLLTVNTAYSQNNPTKDPLQIKDSSIYKDPKPGFYPPVFKWASVVLKPNKDFSKRLFKKDYQRFKDFIEDWVQVKAKKTDDFLVLYSYDILFYKNGDCDIKIDVYLKIVRPKIVKLSGPGGVYNGMFVPFWFYAEGPVTPPRCPPNTGGMLYHAVESQECLAEPM